MATASRRANPPTHPTVWIGLGLAAAGLLVAVYAYTGTRVYDVTYALVALVGGVLALGGILTAAWGRAVVSSRVSRERRSVIQKDAMKLADELDPPPTVAEPSSKKRFTFPKPSALALRRKRDEEPAEQAAAGGGGALFAFRAKSAPPPAPVPESAPVVEAVPVAVPVVERLKLKCPSCGTAFTTEGIRPIQAVCPQCAFTAEV